jgi:heat shock protein HslJ
MPSRVYVFLGFLPLLGLACDDEPASSELSHRSFVSQEITENGSPRPLVDSTVLRLDFRESPRVTASAGCNTLEGRYALADGAFVLSDASTSVIGCDTPRHEQDDWYFAFLGSSPSLELGGDSLVLEDEGTRIVYLDEEAATPDLELVGPTWTVDTIIAGDVASHAEWPAPATLVFGSDGVADVATGCNTGTAEYRITTPGQLVFDSFSVTERGCPDQASAELEAAVLDVLAAAAPVDWEITVERLSLRTGDVGLDLVGSTG